MKVRMLALFAMGLLLSPMVAAHTPNVDSDLSDWCIGAFSNTAPGGGRVEDSGAELVCGNCTVTTGQACTVNADCPGAETCVNLTSKTELIWWDNRTDGAVNDLATIATTQDNSFIYFAAELWVDPDPESLPFAEIALDTQPGGKSTWHDPASAVVTAGTCSQFTDRACTSDRDCHFCQISTEPFPSTRVRACGSACDADIGDVCDTTQTCQGLGAGGVLRNVGTGSTPASLPDYLVVFDFSRWLISAGGATMVMENVNDTWVPGNEYFPAVNPGASGGSGGPPGSVEVAIPWSEFGCTGCPAACSCPAFGPGQPFSYTMMIARGTLTLDFTPDGAVEDVMSESVAGTTSRTGDSCPGFGIGTTNCEIADGSMDAFIPAAPAGAGAGESDSLLLNKNGSDVDMSWSASCLAGDSDYEIYEGVLGNWYAHTPLPGFCSTGGATTATVTPSAGSHYYLIVPSDGTIEGSYGRDSDSTNRPALAGACKSQTVGTCP